MKHPREDQDAINELCKLPMSGLNETGLIECTTLLKIIAGVAERLHVRSTEALEIVLRGVVRYQRKVCRKDDESGNNFGSAYGEAIGIRDNAKDPPDVEKGRFDEQSDANKRLLRFGHKMRTKKSKPHGYITTVINAKISLRGKVAPIILGDLRWFISRPDLVDEAVADYRTEKLTPNVFSRAGVESFTQIASEVSIPSCEYGWPESTQNTPTKDPNGPPASLDREAVPSDPDTPYTLLSFIVAILRAIPAYIHYYTRYAVAYIRYVWLAREEVRELIGSIMMILLVLTVVGGVGVFLVRDYERDKERIPMPTVGLFYLQGNNFDDRGVGLHNDLVWEFDQERGSPPDASIGSGISTVFNALHPNRPAKRITGEVGTIDMSKEGTDCAPDTRIFIAITADGHDVAQREISPASRTTQPTGRRIPGTSFIVDTPVDPNVARIGIRAEFIKGGCRQVALVWHKPYLVLDGSYFQ